MRRKIQFLKRRQFRVLALNVPWHRGSVEQSWGFSVRILVVVCIWNSIDDAVTSDISSSDRRSVDPIAVGLAFCLELFTVGTTEFVNKNQHVVWRHGIGSIFNHQATTFATCEHIFILGTPWKDEAQRQKFYLLAQVSERSGYPAFSSFQWFCRGPRAGGIHSVELHMGLLCLSYQVGRGNLHHDKHGVVLASAAVRGGVEVW